jgi:hypothetical protein
MDKKNAYRHYEQRHALSESDIDQKFHVISILREEFGIHGLTGEIQPIPCGGLADFRLPDIYIKSLMISGKWMNGIIELDGRPHGLGDSITASGQTKARDYDYSLVPNLWTCTLNYSLTKNYERDMVIETLKNSGITKMS